MTTLVAALRAAFILATVLAVGGRAWATEPAPAVPVPQVETGMHFGAIRAVALDAAASLVATAGDDKTVRIWRYPSFRLLNTLRLASGPGVVGRPLAVAFHPSGRSVAVVARVASSPVATVSLQLFDTDSGEVRSTATGMWGADARIAFAPDGEAIALATSGPMTQLRLFRVRDLAIAAEDRQFAAPIVDLKVTAQGRFVCLTADGELRTYSAALARERSRSVTGAGRPVALAASGDGRVAVSFADRPRIEVFSADSLRSLYPADLRRLEGRPPLTALAWGPGDTLYAAESGSGVVHRWQQGGRIREQVFATADEAVGHLAIGKERVAAFTDPAGFRVFDESGRTVTAIRPPILDFRGIGDALRVGENAEAVQFARTGGGTVTFVLPTAELVQQAVPVPLPTPAARALRAAVSDWQSGAPKLRGVPLALEPDERPLSVAASPDGKRLLLGTTWALRMYDSAGRPGWVRHAGAAVSGVAIAPEGELTVAAQGDGTLRWYGVADGEERLALFPHANGTDWIVWNPSGYFLSSPFGDNFVGWHVNNQAGQTPSFYTAVQFERVLYRPDILNCTVRCFGLKRKWQPDRGQPEGVSFISQFRPPQVRILGVEPSSGGDQHRVRFRADPTTLPLTDYSVYVNGIPVIPLKDRRVADGGTAVEREFAVTLPERENVIRVEAFNGLTMGYAERVVEVGTPPRATPKGNLHIVAVGVNEFPNLPKQFQLDFAVRDAEAITQYFQAKTRGNFANVNVRLLTDGAATRANIMRELAGLSDATGNDTVVLYLSSHAISDKAGNYFFAPREMRPEDVAALERGEADGEGSAIAWIRFIDSLRTAAGKRILIVDTCHAAAIQGKTDLFALQKRSAAARFAVLTASKGDEVSMEYAAGKHGLFTYSLLEGLAGPADFDRDRRITLQELFDYVVPTVNRLRPDKRIKQTPQLVAPSPLGRMVFASTESERTAGTVPSGGLR